MTQETHIICRCGGVLAAVASCLTTAIMSLMKSMLQVRQRSLDHRTIARVKEMVELSHHLIKCAYLEIPRRTTGRTGRDGGLAFSSRKKHCNTSEQKSKPQPQTADRKPPHLEHAVNDVSVDSLLLFCVKRRVRLCQILSGVGVGFG